MHPGLGNTKSALRNMVVDATFAGAFSSTFSLASPIRFLSSTVQIKATRPTYELYVIRSSRRFEVVLASDVGSTYLALPRRVMSTP